RRLHRLAAGRSGAGQRRPASSRTPGAVLRERERYGALFTVAEAISAPSEPASTTLRTLLRPGSATSRASSCGAKHLLTAPAGRARVTTSDSPFTAAVKLGGGSQ